MTPNTLCTCGCELRYHYAPKPSECLYCKVCTAFTPTTSEASPTEPITIHLPGGDVVEQKKLEVHTDVSHVIKVLENIASPTKPSTDKICSDCQQLLGAYELKHGHACPSDGFTSSPKPTEPTDELEQLAAWIKRSYQINLDCGQTPQGIETDTSFIMQCATALIRRHDKEHRKEVRAARIDELKRTSERTPGDNQAGYIEGRLTALQAEFADTTIKREEG